MELYFISLFLLVFGGILSIFVKKENKMKLCSVFVGISSLLLSILALNSLITGNLYGARFYISDFFKNTDFIIDPLSAFFILVICLMSFLASLYSVGYIKPYFNKNLNISSHSFFFMLLIASMIGVVTVQNTLFFLVVWEIMSLSSFFLVIFEENKKEVLQAGIKYLVYMHISMIFILCAFVLASNSIDSYSFSDIMFVLDKNTHLANIVFFLAFLGFGTKAGFIPFHNWLPVAHPTAPSHVSGLMSGVMIKTGIYGILRTLFLIGIPSKTISYIVLVVAIVSALWGVLYAIGQHDVKKLLAYHSLENIGIIGIGIGVGMIGMAYNNLNVALLGFLGAILHVVNHSIFKILLFFCAGNIYSKTHTRDIELLGGLIKNMPYTSALFIIGSIAICALPPLNGFISEFLIYAGIIMGLFNGNIASFMMMIFALLSLALIGTMAILCFTKVTGIMLLGNPRSKEAKNVTSDVSQIMLVPMFVLAFLTLLIGVFPQFALAFIISPSLNLMRIQELPPELLPIVEVLGVIGFLCFVFFAIVAIVFALRYLINRKSRTHNTWGCGYNKPSSRIQYTASSYADLFISTLKPLFKRISHIKKPKDLFPKDAYYEFEIEDLEEAYIVKPLIKLDEKILTKFERIQNGNMQQYILFGLIFLILMIVGLFFVG